MDADPDPVLPLAFVLAPPAVALALLDVAIYGLRTTEESKNRPEVVSSRSGRRKSEREKVGRRNQS